MFAIGDKEWPGIGKLIEEAGEVQQVCGKLMGSRGNPDHWSGWELKRALEEELADLQASIWFVTDYNNLDRKFIEARSFEKLTKFDNWHVKGQ